MFVVNRITQNLIWSTFTTFNHIVAMGSNNTAKGKVTNNEYKTFSINSIYFANDEIIHNQVDKHHLGVNVADVVNNYDFYYFIVFDKANKKISYRIAEIKKVATP